MTEEVATLKPPRNVIAARLLASSTLFARSALDAYTAESWETFYLHLGTALEQLIKAVLADVHPSFIADPKADFDSLLHLSGMGHRARKRQAVEAIRTISVTEALERVPRLVDDFVPASARVRLVLDTRNAVVHIGHDPRTEVEAVLGEVAAFMTPLLAAVDLNDAGYWGERWEMVSAHVERRLSAIEAAYERKVQAAKERYGEITGRLDEAGRTAFVAAVEFRTHDESFDTFPVECPACGNLGALTGDPDPEWEPDYDREGLTGVYIARINLSGWDFECRACGLSLDDQLLAPAGLDRQVITDDELLSEATDYYNRAAAEDDWVNSQMD